MVAYKLMYFNIMGRAEPARVLFKAAGVDFEDYRFKDGEFAEMKSKLFFGQAPVLYVDGKELAQSMAIYRFLGRTFGMAGANDWESALCDMYADGMNDVMSAMTPWWGEKDPAKKQEIFNGIIANKVVPFAQRIEKVLAGKSSPHLVGEKLSWTDVYIFCVLGWLASKAEGMMKDFPKLQAMMNAVAEQPNIKAYLAARPHSDM